MFNIFVFVFVFASCRKLVLNDSKRCVMGFFGGNGLLCFFSLFLLEGVNRTD